MKRNAIHGRWLLLLTSAVGACDAGWGLYVYLVRPDGTGLSLTVIGLVTIALSAWLAIRR